MKRVIFDTDPGIGVNYRDIDDGLALLFLIASNNVTVEGVTINFGNTPSEKGYQIAQTLLKITQTDIPLSIGSKAKTDLGKLNPAVKYMIRTVSENPGEISLLATAPLTNIASAMAYDEDFMYNLRDLIIMGGSLKFRPFSLFGEFNFHKDAKAAALVCSSPIYKTLITMDVCSQLVFQQQHLDILKKNLSPVSKYLLRVIPHWLELNKKIFFKAKGFFPWDVVAALYLTHQELFDKNPYTFSIRETGIRSGSIHKLTPCDNFKTTKNKHIPINIPLHLKERRIMELIVQKLCTL
ncbi:MAG: nucleoside hydrolase [Promethearchaeota archaeon]